MPKIILITGGQRSGKSGYAQRLARSLSPHPVYAATSRIWDEEHHRRIERHRRDRGSEWETVEEEKYLCRHDFTGRVVVIDCVTLWCTNFFYDSEGSVEQSLEEIKKSFDELIKQEAVFIFAVRRPLRHSLLRSWNARHHRHGPLRRRLRPNRRQRRRHSRNGRTAA